MRCDELWLPQTIKDEIELNQQKIRLNGSNSI